MKEQNIPLRLFPVTLFSFFGLWGEEWGFRLLCCKFVLWFVFLPWPGHPSLQNVEESLRHVDTTFFLGKVGFLATGAGRDSHCSVHRNTVVKLAHTYRSPLLFCDLEMEVSRTTMAQRLVRMLQICAGHVPGVSALNLLSLLRSSENPSLEDL